jgi:hypothetical protein
VRSQAPWITLNGMTTRSIPRIHPRTDEPAAPDDRRTARAAELAATLGQLDTDHHIFAGSLLASAVNEYATAAHRPWVVTPATPPALLMRAMASLSVRTPGARSRSARVLLDAARATPGATS